MNELRKKRLITILQAISILLGLWGVISVCFAVYIFYSSISEKEFLSLVIAIVGFLIGGYFIFTAYLMIRNFSERAIRHFSAIVSVLLGGSLIQILNTYQTTPFETQTGFIIFFLPLLGIVLLYAIGQKILIKLTINSSNSRPLAPPDFCPPDGGQKQVSSTLGEKEN